MMLQWQPLQLQILTQIMGLHFRNSLYTTVDTVSKYVVGNNTGIMSQQPTAAIKAETSWHR